MAAERIEITDDPGGEAPLEVRLAWIGCCMPVYEHFNDCGHVPAWSRGVLTGKSLKEDGFEVDQAVALKALKDLGTFAALFALRWWNDNKFPHAEECFRFPSRSVRVLEERKADTSKRTTRYDDLDRNST